MFLKLCACAVFFKIHPSANLLFVEGVGGHSQVSKNVREDVWQYIEIDR